MLVVHPEFVVDQKDRKKSVLLPFSEWQLLMEAVEELDDIRAYDKAKAQKDEILPFEEALHQIKHKSTR
jgi:PHD/YefM family antitoxin component YafN of YafNO toxin-antitoxin module